MNCLRNVDVFASPFLFLMQRDRKFKTTGGGTAFFIILLVTGYVVYVYLQKMFERSEMNLVANSAYAESPGQWKISDKDLNIGISLTDDDGIPIENIDEYFSVMLEERSYTGQGANRTKGLREFPLSSCDEPRMISSGPFRCPTGGFNSSLEGAFNDDTFRIMTFTVRRCQGTTSAGTPCRSIEDISNRLGNLRVSLGFNDHALDLRNTSYAVREFMNTYNFWSLDPSFAREADVYLKPMTLLTDDNYLFSYSRTETFLSFDYLTTNIRPQRSDGIVLRANLRLSQNSSTYKRQYWKIADVLSRVMAIFNLMLLLGHVLIGYYSNFKLVEWLINSSFLFKDETVKPKPPSSPTPETETATVRRPTMLRYLSTTKVKNKVGMTPEDEERDAALEVAGMRGPKLDLKLRDEYLNFNFLRNIMPCQSHQKELYDKAREIILRYIDIDYIIEKIQEIDKLKKVLLTRDQIILLNFVPRPQIVKISQDRYRIDDLSLDKYDPDESRKKTAEVIKSYNEVRAKSRRDDKLSKNILGLLDKEFSAKMEQYSKAP
eukprot:TRINITY_DN2790_c0_g2_i1.p1 TRINITY_DN2790_c0_g2~~TRINITY_DN2790_c0_g2_i1.p1  ORF type:complete len:547 (-),score=96.34 TRINITY_DN2790_c0_g2_i1:84-1724(-)